MIGFTRSNAGQPASVGFRNESVAEQQLANNHGNTSAFGRFADGCCGHISRRSPLQHETEWAKLTSVRVSLPCTDQYRCSVRELVLVMLQRTFHTLSALRPCPNLCICSSGGRAGRRGPRDRFDREIRLVYRALEEGEVVMICGFVDEDLELRKWRGHGDVDGRDGLRCEASSLAEGCC